MTRRGFSLPEAIAAAAAAVILAALLLAGARQLQAEARLAASVAQFQWLGHTNFSYAADHGDHFYGFTWKAGDMSSSFPDLRDSMTDQEATAMQAVDIIRRRGRADMPRLTHWISNVRFSHLPLADYLDIDLPEFRAVSPLDHYRLAWMRDPGAFERGELLPYQPDPAHLHELFASSYHTPAAIWDQSAVGSRTSQEAQLWHSYAVQPGHQFGPLRLSDAELPSQKVHVYDPEQRIGSRGSGRWCEAPGSTALSLMADGSARSIAAHEANFGWLPNDPLSSARLRYIHEPRPYEAPTSTGDPRELIEARYRWTRGGIAGRDVGGPEVDTGQP